MKGRRKSFVFLPPPPSEEKGLARKGWMMKSFTARTISFATSKIHFITFVAARKTRAKALSIRLLLLLLLRESGSRKDNIQLAFEGRLHRRRRRV